MNAGKVPHTPVCNQNYPKGRKKRQLPKLRRCCGNSRVTQWGVWASARWAGPRLQRDQSSEGALEQTLAATAGRTLVLAAEPVHHVTGVAAVSTAQAEVGRAPDSHVTDGALEAQVLADGALRPAGLTAAVAAVNAKLC